MLATLRHTDKNGLAVSPFTKTQNPAGSVHAASRVDSTVQTTALHRAELAFHHVLVAADHHRELLVDAERNRDPRAAARNEALLRIHDDGRHARWLEGTATDIRVVPGAGMTEEEFNAAEDKLNALANSVDAKWSCEWYLYKFMAAYANYVWATAEGGPRNSSRKDVAQSQLKILTTELTEQFTGGHGVDGVGATCDGDQEFAAEYGDDVLRRRFVWLWAKVSK